jgi:hypothetical protein
MRKSEKRVKSPSRRNFLKGVTAMLGYEIAEGTLTDGHVKETRRVNYAPHHLQISRRSADGD